MPIGVCVELYVELCVALLVTLLVASGVVLAGPSWIPRASLHSWAMI